MSPSLYSRYGSQRKIELQEAVLAHLEDKLEDYFFKEVFKKCIEARGDYTVNILNEHSLYYFIQLPSLLNFS